MQNASFHSFLERRVKTENLFSTFAAEGVINKENLKSFFKIFLEANRLVSKNLVFTFWEHFSGCPYQSSGMKLALDTALVQVIKLMM